MQEKQLMLFEKSEKQIQKQETNNKILSGDSKTWLRAGIDVLIPSAAMAWTAAKGIVGLPVLGWSLGITAAGSAAMSYFVDGDDLDTAIKKGMVSAGFLGAGILGVSVLKPIFGKFINILKPNSYTGDASKTMMPNLEKTLTPKQKNDVLTAVVAGVGANQISKTNTQKALESKIFPYENETAFLEDLIKNTKEPSSYNPAEDPATQKMIKLKDEALITRDELFKSFKEQAIESGIDFKAENFEDFKIYGDKGFSKYMNEVSLQQQPEFTASIEDTRNQISKNRRPTIEKIQGKIQELQKQNQSLQDKNQNIANQETQMQKKIYDYNNYLADNGITADELTRFSKENFRKKNQLEIAPKETNEILQKIINSPAISNIEKAKFELFGGEEPKISLATIDNIATGKSELTKGSQLNDAFQDLAHTILQEKLPEEHKPAYEYIFKQRKPNQEIVSENEKIIINNEKTIASNENEIQDLSEITDKDVKSTLALEKEFFNINPKTQEIIKEQNRKKIFSDNLFNKKTELFNQDEKYENLDVDSYIKSEKEKNEKALSNFFKDQDAKKKKLAYLKDKKDEKLDKRAIDQGKVKDENSQIEANQEHKKKVESMQPELVEEDNAKEQTNKENAKNAEEKAKAKERDDALREAFFKGASGGALAALLNKFLFPKKQEQE